MTPSLRCTGFRADGIFEYLSERILDVYLQTVRQSVSRCCSVDGVSYRLLLTRALGWTAVIEKADV